MESLLAELSIASQSSYGQDIRRVTRRRSNSGEKSGTIMDRLREEERFSMLVDVLEKNRGLRDDLDSTDSRMTLFAPTNTAFERLHDLLGGKPGSSRRMGQDMPRLEDVLRYHMISEEYHCKDLFDGQLLTSELESRGIDNEKQKIRVACGVGHWHLNWYSTISEMDMKTSNGVIHAIDLPLIPPVNVYDYIFKVPTMFSTFTSAVERVGLKKELCEQKKLTVLVPTNGAWRNINPADLIYLFSPMGCEDLKKIIEYHVLKDLTYYTDLVESKETSCPTLLKGEKVLFETVERSEKERKGRESRLLAGRGRGSEKHPADYLFVLNRGEALIKHNDFIAKNGNMHIISSVLIPECVKLPSQKESKGRGRW